MPQDSAPDSADSSATKITTAYPAAGKQYDFNGVPHILVPDNCELKPLERSLGAPTRIRAQVVVHDLDSFLKYAMRFVSPGTQIFAKATVDQLMATAIFDYAEKDKPAWGEHRLTFVTKFTPEWQRWRSNDKTVMGQQEFAEFVEDNNALFVDPCGADMLTIAREIELRTQVEWKGMVRLDNGDTALNYTSTTKAGNGAVELPPFFVVSLQPFLNGPRYQMRARLRPRLDNATLGLKYEMLKVEEFVRGAMDEILERIEKESDIVPLRGETPDKV